MSKTIFITGAGSGLGRGTAIGLAKKGHHVIATTETTSQKTDLMREANDKELSMEVFKLDITNEIDLAQINRYDFMFFLRMQPSMNAVRWLKYPWSDFVRFLKLTSLQH